MDAIGVQAAQLQREWETDPRWAGITRDYSARDVIRLRGCVAGEHSLSRDGASRLWDLLHRQDAAPALGAVVGDRAAEAARAGCPPSTCLAGRRATGAWPRGLSRSAAAPGQPDAAPRPPDQQRAAERGPSRPGREPRRRFGPRRRLIPVVADADAGFGAVLGAFELMTAMIEAGAAGVRFEDQLSPGGARADLGGKVLVPTGQHIEALTAARLAADVLGVPSLIIARSGAHAASLLTSDTDERDHEFLTGERTAEGFHRVEPGWYACVTRELAFAPYADVLWLETPAAGPGRGPRVRLHHPLAVPGQVARPTAAPRPSPGGPTRTARQSRSSRWSWPRWATNSSRPSRPGAPVRSEPSSEPADRLTRNHGTVYA